MKKIIIILFLTISASALAQQKGIVYYGFIEALGIGNAKGPDSNAYMTFNKDQSYYVTAKDSLENSDYANSEKIFLNEEGGGGTIYNGMAVSPQGDQVVNNKKEKKMYSSFIYWKKMYYVKEEAIIFDWKITNETKKIGSFKCKKATTKFRGRNYIAWFAPEIPVSYGPWKLNGLPGLILEAYDTFKVANWYFKSVEYPTNKKVKVDNIRKSKGEKKIVFLNLDGLKKFRENERIRVRERGIMMKKKFPEVNVEMPDASQMFLEYE